MVLQSELATSLMNSLEEKEYVVKLGYSSTVDYSDDALDSVIVTKSGTDVSVNVIDNVLTVSVQLGLADGVGSTFNAILVEDSEGNAIKKDLFTSFTKTISDIVQFQVKIVYIGAA
ncbi:MAG: hypothetical protein EOL97_09585 [Spirochaetia bacterium]|nr:hypothetical protein [Spirochaetia bacterium]